MNSVPIADRPHLLRLSRLPSGEPEIFASIQGEGVTCGLPSVFVRLALCNLECSFCDTAYTWDWTHYDRKAEIIGLEAADVVQRVMCLLQASPAGEPLPPTPSPARRGGVKPAIFSGGSTGRSRALHIRNVVITGGEPLLQQRALVDLAAALKAEDARIEVETNGTIRPQQRLGALADQWNVSPKLASSGNRATAREVADALAWFAACPTAYFKFVVVEPADLDEVAALAARYDVPTDRMLLMPEGTDPETLAARSTWLVERCQMLGYRFSTRLHILLWGDQRGR